MGRKKKAVLIEEADDGRSGDIEDLSPSDIREIEEQERTEELLSEFKERFVDQPAKILVEKYDSEGDWAICRKYPLISFEQEHVKAEFGGGKYRGILLDQGGKYVKGGRINFKFAEAVNKEPAEKKPDNPLENPVVLMMIKSMEANQHNMMEFAKAFMSPGAPGVNAPKSNTLGEVVEVVKSLNSMTTKDKPLDNIKETLGLLKLVKEATGDSDDKGGLLSEIREFLEMAPMLKDQLANLKPQATPTQITAGAPLNGKEAKPQMDPLTKKIVELVPKFVGGAQSNAPVGEWGNYLLEIFDTEVLPLLLPAMKAKYKSLVKDEDDLYDIVLRLAQDPEERAEAFKQIVPLAPYQAWCNLVIDEAIRLAQAPDVEEAAIVTTVAPSTVPIMQNGKEL